MHKEQLPYFTSPEKCEIEVAGCKIVSARCNDALAYMSTNELVCQEVTPFNYHSP